MTLTISVTFALIFLTTLKYALTTSSKVPLDPIYLSITPPESPDLPRFGASESSSSKKITQGVALLARLKTTSSMFDKIKGILINMNRPTHFKSCLTTAVILTEHPSGNMVLVPSLIFSSLWPTYILINSGPFTLEKLTQINSQRDPKTTLLLIITIGLNKMAFFPGFQSQICVWIRVSY